MNIKQNWPYLL